MNDQNVDPGGIDLEAMLRDIDGKDLELLDPPDEIWEGIEAATSMRQNGLETVVPTEFRWWAASRVLIGVAAALIVVMVLVFGFLVSSDDGGEVLAAATLEYDPVNFDALGNAAAAEVELISNEGKLTINLVNARLPSPGEGADLEVWLIRPDADGNVADLISLGVVDSADPGSLDVPPGHDPAVFHIVDISIEPRDGDASHSGRSILRGPLHNA